MDVKKVLFTGSVITIFVVVVLLSSGMVRAESSEVIYQDEEYWADRSQTPYENYCSSDAYCWDESWGVTAGSSTSNTYPCIRFENYTNIFAREGDNITILQKVMCTSTNECNSSLWNKNTQTWDEIYSRTAMGSYDNVSISILSDNYVDDGVVWQRMRTIGVSSAYYYEGMIQWTKYTQWLNITFWNDTDNIQTNGTVTSDDIEIDYEDDNVTILSEDLGEGIVSISFGDQQFFKYRNVDYTTDSENQNWTDMIKKAYIMDNWDMTKEFVVTDGTKAIEGANVWIYRIINDEEYIVQGFFSDEVGEGQVVLESGKIYKVCTYHDDYETVCESVTISIGSTDTIELQLTGTTITHDNLYVTSTCGGTIYEPGTCTIRLSSATEVTNCTYYWTVNGSATIYSKQEASTETAGTQGYICSESFAIDWTNATIEIRIFADGTHVANVRYKLTDYLWDVAEPPDFTAADNEDKGLAILLMMILAGAVAGVANHIIPKSGLYVYGIVMGIWGTALQVLSIPLVFGAFMIVMYIAQRMLPGKS